MRKLFTFVFIISFLVSCDTNSPEKSINAGPGIRDTLSYPYKAIYSSDLVVPSHPENAQKVLTVWKMYENNQIDAMKPYYADTVTYDDANGNHYYGPSGALLELAKKEMEKLDSL